MFTQFNLSSAAFKPGNLIQTAFPTGTAGKSILRLMLLVLLVAIGSGMVNAQTPGYSKTGGTSVSANLFNSVNVAKSQFIYLPTDFSATPINGTITRIYFRNTTASSSAILTNLKVSMGQTASAVFPGATSLEFFTGLTPVKNSASITLTGNATVGGWFFIDLDTPFLYDNTRNLIVEIQFDSFNGGISVYSTSSGVVPAHKKVIATTTTATSGTQDTNGWPNLGIDVTPLPACSGTPTPGNAVSSLTTACVGVNFNLSLTGTSVVSGLTYQWQSSTNGTSNWTDIAGATANRLTTSQTATNFYRANVSCGTSTAASGSVQVITTVAPLGGTYTINKNNPVSATNYLSLSSFVSDMTCKGVSGPVIVNVVAATGPYNEQVVFTPVPGASTTNTITFNGNNNVVSTVGTAAERTVIRLDGADFIKLDNFQINASDTGFGWGIHFLNGADNNIISNSIINIASTNISEGASAGIIFTSNNNSITGGNNGNNNLISGNTITGGYTGIYLNNNLTATGNNLIRNNFVKDFITTGIRVNAAKGTLVEGNDLSRPLANLGSEFNGIYVTGGSYLTTISKNRLHNTHDAATGTVLNTDVNGIYLSSSDAPAGSENVVKNNLIYNINNIGKIYALYNNSSDGAWYYHNSINLDNATNIAALHGFDQTTTATNIRFINNIINIVGGTGTNHALFYDASLSAIISNNNVLSVTNGNIGRFGGTDMPTLADWKAVNGGLYDQNSLSVNPNFVNVATGNLQPGNSTINNIGQPVASVTEDILGATRNITTPDPGAYEFNSPTTNDAGVVSVITPANSVAPGISAIEVVIKNYGSAALTSASITWTVNAIAQTPYSWTGNLAPGASALVNIGNYTFLTGAFTLNVCTATPNGQTDQNTSNDCFTFTGNSCTALAGTYTIDKNSPVTQTNYQSFTAAIQKLTSCGISAPVTFNVVAGTGPYTEQLLLSTIPGTNAVNTVKFEGNFNKISFSPASATVIRPVIYLNGTDYVTFNNFEIEAPDATFGWGVQFTNGADNNVISNNTINIAATSTVETNSVGVIFTNSNSQFNAPGNTGNNNIISGNTITGGFKGIMLNGNAAVNSQNQLKNNFIKDFYGQGIVIASAKGTLVEGNEITRPLRNTVLSISYGINLTDNASATIVSKNQIHNTQGAASVLTGSVYAIVLSSADAAIGSENIIKNNLIYDINTKGSVYGLYNLSSDGAYYYHNTVDIGFPTQTGAMRGFYLAGTATNVKLINNVISLANSTSTGTKHAIYFDNATSSITSNNNDLYVTNGNIGFYSTVKATLADWQAVNNNAYDQNSISSDPAYVNASAGNLQPSAGVVNNIGQPLAAVTDDITGAPRNTTTPDPGAYEFLAAQTDAGIIAISGPATTGCGLSNAETITVTIKNFGSQTLTSIPVEFKVNNVLIASETYPGSLLGNATVNYTFVAKANLSVPGANAIVAKTNVTADGNTTNDAFTLSRANALFTTLPVILDFETTTTGLPMMKTIFAQYANVNEGTGASNGTGSTKGMIMDGVTSFNWTPPYGTTNPWTANPDHFAGAYFCVTPGASNPKDSLILSFDLKQLYKLANANTNFRVTVNGTQVGPTYRPPFAGTPINWQKIRVNLSSYKTQPTIEIGLESNVKEEYDNGNGTANLIDNIKVQRIIVSTTGIAENSLKNNLVIYPNPSAGIFNLNVPVAIRSYKIEVLDLTGKVMKQQVESQNTGTGQLNLKGATKGIYLLKITSEGQTAIQKLIIE
jgi:hypothetical protein